jgi:signal transduction histidine kinase
MGDRRSLRFRIVAACVLLACVVCGTFAAVVVHVIGTIEDRLIDERLERTADRLVERLHRGLGMDLPPSVSLYRGADIPAPLRGKPPGRYELDTGGPNTVNALVRSDGRALFVLTDDDADFERIRWDVYALLAGAFVACVVLAVMLGRFTASRVIAPVVGLARAVNEERPADQFPSLDSRDEMGVLARAFAARTEELQRFLQRERWFVGDVSHELRTPLTVMLGAAEVLCMRLADRPELAQAAERIRRTAADTTQRVAAMLLLSRAPETVEAPRTALLPLIRQEMERVQPLLAGKDVALRLQAPQEVHVFAAPELAAIAIGNLLRNACQFTEQGAVTVHLAPQRLVVEDTGAGIPADIRERVFERFVRAYPDAGTGSGLGLAIVRRVAEHLRWEVTLEDVPGGGSRFTLLMPNAS